MKILILMLLFLRFSLFAESTYQPSLWDFIPGIGQFRLGNTSTGAFQLGLFISFLAGADEMIKRPDYIKPEETFVRFSFKDAILADYLEKQGFLYQTNPFENSQMIIFSETYYQRQQRLIEKKMLYEINPLLQYGKYERKTYANANAELFSQSALHIFFYSAYSTYRDSGRISNHYNESFLDLVMAPFNKKYLLSPYFYIPVGLLLAGLSYQTKYPPLNPEWMMVSPTMKKSGYMQFYSTVVSFNAGVGEEAFFRGYLNHYFIHKTNKPVWGILISSALFGLGHFQNSPLDVIFPTIAGIYFGFLHYINNWDIRQGIAIHFWWDFLIFTYSLRYVKEDKNVFKSQREIHFMPILYTYKY